MVVSRRIASFAFVGVVAFMVLAFSGGMTAQGSSENELLTILWRWWSPYGPPINTDHMTTKTCPPDLCVGADGELPWGYFEGATFYVPRDAATGRHPVYRLYSPIFYNHADSLFAGEGGFNTDFVLGYPYDARPTGGAALIRWVGVAPAAPADDHMTVIEGEDWSSFGYSLEGPLGYGYRRFGNQCEVNVTVSNSAVSNNLVTLTSNQAAGGAITQLVWNGHPFVNNYDYGRQIQIAMFKTNIPGHTDGSDNPTEGGDTHSCNAAGTSAQPAGWSHGSPLLASSVSGNTLSTTTRPLQFIPAGWGGGLNNPVAWTGTFSKVVQVGIADHPRIIQWTASANFPVAATGVDLQLAVAHLIADFNRFYVDDAAQAATGAAITEITSDITNDGIFDITGSATGHAHAPDQGAVILATATGDAALAMYRTADAPNGNVFGASKYQNHGSVGQYGLDTNAISVRAGGSVDAGPFTRTVYLVVGTLDNVRADIRWLRANGY